MCLYPDDECEQTVHADEIGSDPVLVARTKGLIALLIANPIQFIFELLSIYLIKIRFDDQKVGDNCMILSF
jgi:hypothetical protein